MGRKREIDPNEAPEGHYAAEAYGCEGCAFLTATDCPKHVECCRWRRKDGCDVIFVKKEDCDARTRG